MPCFDACVLDSNWEILKQNAGAEFSFVFGMDGFGSIFHGLNLEVLTLASRPMASRKARDWLALELWLVLIGGT